MGGNDGKIIQGKHFISDQLEANMFFYKVKLG
jgi:hypothetical protein